MHSQGLTRLSYSGNWRSPLERSQCLSGTFSQCRKTLCTWGHFGRCPCTWRSRPGRGGMQSCPRGRGSANEAGTRVKMLVHHLLWQEQYRNKLVSFLMCQSKHVWVIAHQIKPSPLYSQLQDSHWRKPLLLAYLEWQTPPHWTSAIPMGLQSSAPTW